MTVTDRRVLTARILTAVAAIAAAAAAAQAGWALGDTAAATRVVETWRAYGLAVFAALFALLATRPLARRWLWEIVLAHKAAMTATALVYHLTGAADDTAAVIAADGALTVLLGAAYVLCRGWTAKG